MTNNNQQRRRRGFTLVEILVAMALTIFILTIMAECFVAGTDLFRGLKAVGDLNQSLRTATNIMGSDLAADHFEAARRLSDSSFWSSGTTTSGGPPKMGYFYLEQNPTLPPIIEGADLDGVPVRRCVGHKLAFTIKARGYLQQNYFAAQIPQSVDPILARAPLKDIYNYIPNPDSQYQQPATGFFTSQWVEVCYFLSPVPGSFTAQGTPLYGLYRQQRLVLADNTGINWTVPAGSIPGAPPGLPATKPGSVDYWLRMYQPKFSCRKALGGTTLYFNNPADLTIPELRAAAAFPFTLNAAGTAFVSGAPDKRWTPVNGVAPLIQAFAGATFSPIVDINNNPTGEDLLLTDVLSFEVTALMSNNAGDFYDLPTPSPAPVGNLAPPTAPVGPGIFDTWSNRRDGFFGLNYMNASQPPVTLANPLGLTSTPIPTSATNYRILGLKITIRVYDESSQVTRQVTLIQDM
jgi:prepilin-type N-terminal cleavage/methylation domain-containing protein